MSYTDAERRVLLAGLLGGHERDAVWARQSAAIESLAHRGLVRVGQELLGDGTINSFPLCLSPAGVLEARSLGEFDEIIQPASAYEHTYWSLAARGSVRI